MFPHERSLVKRLADKPFVLLGVNSDQSREDVKAQNEKAEITWRSWFAGPGGGEIAKQYKVPGWPTLYLIDPKGVVRHAFVGNPGDKQLDELIDQMLQEAEKAGS
jgi:hypothetical protein